MAEKRQVSRTVLCIALAGGLMAAGPSTQARTVSSVAELAQALKTASKGEVISLASGVYDDIEIKDFHGEATLTSADPSHRAVVHTLGVTNSSGLTFDGLDFLAQPLPAGRHWQGGMAFHLFGVTGVALKNLEVHSDPATPWQSEDGGIGIADSQHVLVADSDFHDLHAGISHGGSSDLTFRNNKLHHLLDDGIRGGGSNNMIIDGNHCWSNHYVDQDDDHPDCIQFWTAGTHGPTHDIWIQNNSYERGEGEAVQGIFVSDEAKQGYQRVVITGNRLHGAQWNGIVVDSGDDVLVEDNVVCSGAGQDSWIAIYGSTNVVARFNRAYLIRTDGTKGADLRNNKIEACK